MANTIFLILFIFPGMLVNIIFNRIYPECKENQSAYLEGAKAFVISTLIFFVDIFYISFVLGISINNMDDFTEFMNNYINFRNYFFIALITSLIFALLLRILEETVIINVINFIRGDSPKEGKFKSPWHELFENPKFNIDNRVIGIFKGIELVTIGFIDSYSSPDRQKKEFKIIYSDWFVKKYKEDDSLDTKDKLFNKIDAEYYDISNNLLIKFYDSEKILKEMCDIN